MRQEETRFFPDPGDQFVEIVGGGSALACFDPLFFRDVVQQPILAVVDELAFLPLLDNLNGQAQLLGDLVIGDAVEIGHARVDIDYRVDRTEHVLACVLLIIHVGLRQIALVAVGTIHGDLRFIFHPVQPVNTRFHWGPL